jgi:hypothetical protein
VVPIRMTGKLCFAMLCFAVFLVSVMVVTHPVSPSALMLCLFVLMLLYANHIQCGVISRFN